MELLKEDLIISDNNFSVYEKTTDITPSEPKIGIGGYITVVDNNSGERCWKEWKWHQRNDDTYYNDRDDVIEMLLRSINVNKVGASLDITDKNKHVLSIGDIIQYGEYKGVLLYNYWYNEYGIFYGMWYGDDKYNPDSYGKFIAVPMDNSDKSEITLIEINDLYGLR